MRNPLLPITVALAAGIGFAPHFYFSASQQVLWIAVILFLALLLLRFERYLPGMILALIGMFLCGTFLAAEEHSVLPPHHIASLARRGVIVPQEELQITGWARTPSVHRPGGEYFDLEVDHLMQSNIPVAAEGRVRLYYYSSSNKKKPLAVAYGTPVSLPVRNLRRPRNFMTAGFFDWEASMQRREIYFTGVIREAADVTVLPGRRGSRWRSVIYGLRGRLLDNLDRLYPPRQGELDRAAILKALLLGDENWLKPDVASPFQQTGTYHLLVISGLHIAALAFGLFRLLALLYTPKWLETLLISLCVILFTLLADANMPALRAMLMTLIYLAARLVYRERALLNAVAASALILLLFHPSDLFDPGFQLSFLAVGIIATVAAPLVSGTIAPYRMAFFGLEEKDRDSHLEPRQAQFRQDLRILLDYFCDPSRLGEKRWQFLRRLLSGAGAGLLAVAGAIVAVAIIQTGLSLSMATYFNRVVWAGLLANFLVLPIIGVLIPLGFFVLMGSAIWWPAAVAGSRLLGALVWLLHRIVGWSAEFPHLDRRVPAPPLWI